MYYFCILIFILNIMATGIIGYFLRKHLLHVIAKLKEIEKIKTRYELETLHCRRLEELHEQYDIVMHDLRHMLRTAAALAKEGDCSAISLLIDKTGIEIGSIEQFLICSNKLLNAQLLERKGYACDSGVALDIEITEPLHFRNIDEMDMIALIGNLLDNAIEAEKNAACRKGIMCSIKMSREGRHLIIHIENSYAEGAPYKRLPVSPSGKVGSRHGIGLISVHKIIKKYGGIIESDESGGRYYVKAVIPVYD